MAAAALHEEYQTRVIEALRNSQGYQNIHQVPKVTKVVVNTCVNAGLADYKQALEEFIHPAATKRDLGADCLILAKLEVGDALL